MAITSLEITVEATHKQVGDASKEFNEMDLMAYNSYDEFEEAVKEWLEELEPAEGIDSKAEDWEWGVDDWGNIHENYQSLDEDLFEYVNAVGNSSYGQDVIDAAIACDIDIDDVDEAYNGSFESDEDFAENICKDCGYIPNDLPSWIVIDWEETAKNVMQDYVESDGHYFRVF